MRGAQIASFFVQAKPGIGSPKSWPTATVGANETER
jgi:hypothetical protein